jgi:hypothetical protein
MSCPSCTALRRELGPVLGVLRFVRNALDFFSLRAIRKAQEEGRL